MPEINKIRNRKSLSVRRDFFCCKEGIYVKYDSCLAEPPNLRAYLGLHIMYVFVVHP